MRSSHSRHASDLTSLLTSAEISRPDDLSLYKGLPMASHLPLWMRARCSLLRSRRAVIMLGCLFTLVFAAFWMFTPGASADHLALFNDPSYHAGAYGPFPTHSFHTTSAVAPRVHFSRFDPTCKDGRMWFFEAHSPKLPYSAVFILEADGTFVWSKTVMKNPAPSYRQPTISNFRPFTVNETQYLAYWTGTQIGAFGQGEYHLLDAHYEEKYVLSGQNGLQPDPHELFITPAGTAIYSSYFEKEMNLTRFGHENGTLWDSGFQEVDIASGALLFEWRASDHFALDDMVVDSFSRGDYDMSGGLDWFHINSVDKDKNGDYLISSRYMSALILISGTDGKPKWVLGGRRNEFEDLSGGKATNFFCQHMARWSVERTEISLFDNGAYWGEKRRHAQGLKLSIDAEQKTVRLQESIALQDEVWSESQGSMQLLDDGSSVLGFGYAPRISQFDAHGKLVCDMEIAPNAMLVTEKKTGFTINEWAQSYRSTKLAWNGTPSDPPSAVLAAGHVYVSWLGDTETASWELRGLESDEGWLRREKHVQLGHAKKTSFETKISLKSGAYISFMELRAYDKKGNPLGHWKLSGLDGTVAD